MQFGQQQYNDIELRSVYCSFIRRLFLFAMQHSMAHIRKLLFDYGKINSNFMRKLAPNGHKSCAAEAGGRNSGHIVEQLLLLFLFLQPQLNFRYWKLQ